MMDGCDDKKKNRLGWIITFGRNGYSSSFFHKVNRKCGIKYRCCCFSNSQHTKKHHLITPVIIVPGYGADAKEYTGLKVSLEYFGWKCFIAPIQWHHWIPTIGGRPVTPILEKLSMTVQQVLKDCETDKVHLVAHSAAGWICRIWLGSGVYCGVQYDCQKLCQPTIS
ncbi:hypothetical protein Gasu2_60940 [Galdieria sulphuraria]|nr:hypothetical protein Gasu2_60940 [Galdieria sulphuraria]